MPIIYWRECNIITTSTYMLCTTQMETQTLYSFWATYSEVDICNVQTSLHWIEPCRTKRTVWFTKICISNNADYNP